MIIACGCGSDTYQNVVNNEIMVCHGMFAG